MKSVRWLLAAALLLLFAGCEKEAAQTPNTNPPALLYEDVLYFSTGRELSVEMDESACLGTIGSTVPGTQWPTENAQANFPGAGCLFARYEGDAIAVLINNEWILFETQS